MNTRVFAVLSAFLLGGLAAIHAAPMGSAFTYQGRLATNGVPVTGTYDIYCYLYDSPTNGTLQSQYEVESCTVSNGLFTTTIDLGNASVFDGRALWLELAVRRTIAGEAYTTLQPRQPITPVPYTLQASMAATVPNGSITTAKLAVGAVTATNIANGAIGSNQIAAGTITTANLAPGTVGQLQLQRHYDSGTIYSSNLFVDIFQGTPFAVNFNAPFAQPPAVVMDLQTPSIDFATSTKAVSQSITTNGFTGNIAPSSYFTNLVDQFDSAANTVTGIGLSAALINGLPAASFVQLKISSGIHYLCYATTTNGPDTASRAWTVSIVQTNGGSYTSLAEVNGRPAIAFDGPLGLSYRRATNATGWAPPIVISTNGYNASMSMVAGRPAVSFWANQQLKYMRALDTNGTSWPAAATTVDATVNVGEFSTLLVVNGNPAISYYDVTRSNIYFIRSTDTNGTSWGTKMLLMSNIVEKYSTMAIVDGTPTIVCAGTNSVIYLHARDASGSIWTTPGIIMATNAIPSALSLGRNNWPIVLATRADVFGNGGLYYLQANNVSGTSWNPPINIKYSPDNACTLLINGGVGILYHDPVAVTTKDSLYFISSQNLPYRINWIAVGQ